MRSEISEGKSHFNKVTLTFDLDPQGRPSTLIHVTFDPFSFELFTDWFIKRATAIFVKHVKVTLEAIHCIIPSRVSDCGYKIGPVCPSIRLCVS